MKDAGNRRETVLRNGMRRALLGVAGGLMLALFASTSPAQAHDRRGEFRGHGDGRGHGAMVRQRQFVVPSRVYAGNVAVYRPWFDGRVYFRPHHHYHAVYSFPVYTTVGVIYQPHVYCDGGLFVDAHPGYRDGHRVDGFFAFSGRNFGIAVGF